MNTLANLIDRKHACLEQLRELGRRQFLLAEGGDVGALVKVLSAKQHLIGILHKVERELDPFRGQDPDKRPWRSTADREQCARQADACEQILREIMVQEKESERVLVARRDEAATRLQGMHTASRARTAYTCDSGAENGALDLTSNI